MSFFRRPDYESDTTQFINQLKATKPELDAQQRAIWQEYNAGRVAQQPYVYQSKS
jgi:hypothetical protein